MNLRTLNQAIASQKAEIDRLTSNAEALEVTASGMPPADRERAHQTAAKVRRQIQAAIITLHGLEAQLPGTLDERDWQGRFDYIEDPLRLPAEMAHLWGGSGSSHFTEAHHLAA
ncbi:MAG: hypothetical protein V4662_25095 [Verrucomicrobiota bacterium]